MNYLQSFLEEKRRAEKPKFPTDKTDKSPSEDSQGGFVSFVSEPERRGDAKSQSKHPTASRTVTPNSRNPLVKPEVRAKIEAIEADARDKGWPAELLWNAGFWDCPRGVAAVLDAADEISEVTPEYIAILKTKSDLLKFRRNNA